MKKVIAVLILGIMLVSTNAFALKRVEDITAHDVASVPELVLNKTGDALVWVAPKVYDAGRFVLKILAQPFYWAEQVAN